MSVFSKEIQVFVAVYESKSFASAAHQLNIDPAHVSRVVQRLEDSWNTRFFVRHSRGVEPLSSAHDLFAALDGAKKQLMMSNLARTQGSLKAKIGFSQSTGATHLARHVLPVLISAGFDLETSISTSQNLIQKIQIRDDFLAVNWTSQIPNSCCLVPETMLSFFPKLKSYRTAAKQVPIQALTWPRSPVAKYTRQMKKSALFPLA
jgi:hypothetical protein